MVHITNFRFLQSFQCFISNYRENKNEKKNQRPLEGGFYHVSVVRLLTFLGNRCTGKAFLLCESSCALSESRTG